MIMECTNNKPVVVFSINHFGIGGAQRQLVRLLPQLVDTFTIHLFVLQAPVGGVSFVTELPDDIVIHQFAFRRIWSPGQWLSVYRTMRQIRPSVIVSSLFVSNFVLRVLGQLQKIPVIAREHNTVVNRRWHHRYIERQLGWAAEPIIAVSKEVADAVSQDLKLPRSTYQVIQNGIDLKEIDVTQDTDAIAAWREQLRFSSDVRIMLSVGRLVQQKRLDVLISGFAEFIAQAKNEMWRLVIVGEGSERSKLESLTASLEITDKVHFVGAQSSPHVFYQLTDCFVSTSAQEGMSNVHLEALAHGVPIITTPTGGTSAIVVPGETGLFIAGPSSDEVAVQLQQFASDTTTDWQYNCQQHRTQFSITKTATSYRTLLARYTN